MAQNGASSESNGLFQGALGGPFGPEHAHRTYCVDGKKLSGESIVSVSPDNLWIIDSRISSIAKTRAVGPKLQNIKLFQIRRQNKRARSAQNGGVKPINATAFENKLMLVQIQRGWVSHWLASVIGIEVKLQKCEYFYIPDVTLLWTFKITIHMYCKEEEKIPRSIHELLCLQKGHQGKGKV